MRLYRYLISCLIFISFYTISIPATSALQTTDARVAKSYGKLPLSFVENKGQMDKSARFVIRGPRASAFFRNDGVTFDLWEASKVKPLDKRDMLQKMKLEIPSKPEKRKHAVFKLTFKGADPKCRVKGIDTLPGKVNYLIGKDKSKWRTNISTYKGMIYKNIWQGIDVIYRGDRSQLKYDIRVNPDADIRKVQLQYDGAQKMWLDKKGDLHIKTAVTEFIEKVPGIYQEKSGKKIDVAGGYELLDKKTVGFSVKNVDPKLPLVIDPASDLVYSTFLGGSVDDWACGIAVDSSGCAYVTGYTASSDFPAAQENQKVSIGIGGNYDVFVVKLNASGNTLIYSTILGGSNVDIASGGITVDPLGCTYIAGYTYSSNFPVTTGALQTSKGGSRDAFMAKLNTSGNNLVYSTYLGGNGIDSVYRGITVDSSGCTYFAGSTTSTNFPITPGALQTSLGSFGSYDTFVAKLNALGTALIYSTYLGGADIDLPTAGLTVDSSGCAYVAGYTFSSDFPTTPGALQTDFNGSDAFVAKLNPSGSALVYSTFLNGNNFNLAHGSIAVDSSDCLYITGITSSSSFSTTPGALQTSINGSNDVFVSKLNASGSVLLYSTYLGGSGDDRANGGIAIDSLGCAYIAGYTRSMDFPTTPGALQTDSSDFSVCDAFVSKLNESGSTLVYSTYLLDGSFDYDYGGVFVDSSGYFYAAGYPNNSKFPITPGALQTSIGGGYDSFVMKLDPRPNNVDLFVKTSIESTYSGIGLFSIDGENQTKSQNASPGQQVTYVFKVKNAGDADGSFKISGPGSIAGWNIRYYESNTGTEVTSQVTGAGWSSGTLAPGATKGIFVNVKSDSTLSLGSTNTLLITAASDSDNTKIDVVKAVTTFTGIYKTDMLIKSGPETSYTGAGTYSTDGANQTKSQNVCAGQKVTFGFRARNGGNAIDSFRITGPAGGSGWSVKYYDFTTSTDVTSQVTGAGWVSSTLAPGTIGGVFVNIKPDSTVPLGSSITLTVTGTSESDNTKIDVVKSVTTCVASYKPDLMIKLGTESTYSGLDIINTDGTDQTKTQNAAINQKVTCAFRVKNAGYLSDSFIITGPSGGSGWTVKYCDLVTGADVTSQVTGTGWLSGTMAPGTDRGVYAKITPDATVTSGSSKTLTITATSVGNSAKIDVVKAVTVVP